MERRKENIRNFGSTWIKPAGVNKSLHQIREEEREMKEHAENLRREALAQELAEAEAEAASRAMMEEEGMDMQRMGLQAGGINDIDNEEDVRDLDDDIPEADMTGLDADDDDDEEEEEEEEEEEDFEDEDAENDSTRELPPRGVLAAQISSFERRSAISVRGGTYTPRLPPRRQLNEGASDDDEEADHSGMLQEEDLIRSTPGDHQTSYDRPIDLAGLGMDMDADLDLEIPFAEEAGEYEHTDTEEELSSSEEEEEEEDSVLEQQGNTISQVRSDGTQDSSPVLRRRV